MNELRDYLIEHLGEKYRFQIKHNKDTFLPRIDVCLREPFQCKYTLNYSYDAIEQIEMYEIKDYRTASLLATVR